MSEDRQERSDRLRQRFDRDHNENEENAETDSIVGEASDQMDTDESIDRSLANADTTVSDKTKDSKKSIKDRPSVLMYLPEELHTELDIRFDELNARYKREYGRPLEKNRDYYPAVVKASLEGKEVEDVLDI